MRNRLKHKMHRLLAAGERAEEASPEDVRKYLDEPAATSLQALPTPGWVVGKNKKNGRLLISGEQCLSTEYWETVMTGTREECSRYVNGGNHVL